MDIKVTKNEKLTVSRY